ncbi:bZIP transcription factor [Lecanosticta acicola]|uniref:BZIP transcription factor n=1 Tax=Lecanosticta acicola TaxID=111012 RepID=A0AAI9EF21_9PEZI|nr:bZIP transcription factor [Lecanosticta acicola]
MAVQLQQQNRTGSPYLSPNQRHLLLAALNSQAGGQRNVKRTSSDLASTQPDMGDAKPNVLFMSPQNAEIDEFDYTPELDYLDNENFDFENADLGGDMIGALPGSGADNSDATVSNADGGHEKRKSPDENGDSEAGDAKRQETQEGEKAAKKPGRKPLTSEPTTKRKAQNRAAQRAFRERKEKHLKDLESKVSELTKSSEADKHENGRLKAQVERLQTELREYRKRLSLNSSSVNRSPPLSATHGTQRSSSASTYGGNFQFDFPKFGALPGSQIFGNQGYDANSGILKRDSTTPPITQSPTTIGSYDKPAPAQSSRHNSTGRSRSPTNNNGNGPHAESPVNTANFVQSFAPYSTTNNMHGFASTLPQMGVGNDAFSDLFSPSILKSANANGYFNNSQLGSNMMNAPQNYNADSGNDSTSGLTRVFQFSGGSNASDSTSPSASSTSQWNANGGADSSCGTSPEPSHDSPANKDKHADSFDSQTQNSGARPSDSASHPQTGLDATFGFGGVDLHAPPASDFDPVLFGDYRESNDAIIGGGDFSGGFFDDALSSAPFDFGSPSNLFGILQSPGQTQTNFGAAKSPAPAPSKNLMAEIEKTCGGDDDFGLPGGSMKQTQNNANLISCNNIWNQLQSNPDFQEGKFDLDSLCSELRKKARCSESGVMVDQNHVDAALRTLGKKDEKGKPHNVPALMFEQNSWDNVLKKLREGKTT